MSHNYCPKCLQNIVRLKAGPKELCGVCDPGHKTRRRRGPLADHSGGRKPKHEGLFHHLLETITDIPDAIPRAPVSLNTMRGAILRWRKNPEQKKS